MEWFDLPWGFNEEPGGVLELSEQLTPQGLALELHIFVTCEGTRATWLLENGSAIWQPAVGST
jgi:hypothetical protein